MTDQELFMRAFSHGYILTTEAPKEAEEYEQEFSQSKSKYAIFFMKGAEIGKEYLRNRNRDKGKGFSM